MYPIPMTFNKIVCLNHQVLNILLEHTAITRFGSMKAVDVRFLTRSDFFVKSGRFLSHMTCGATFYQFLFLSHPSTLI